MNHWSLTSIKTFEQCGFKAKLKYVLHEKEKRSTSASRGTDTHGIIENFLKLGTPLSPELEFYESFLTGLKSYEIYPEHPILLSSDWNQAAVGDNPWVKAVLDLQIIKGRQSQEGDSGTISSGPPTEAIVYDWKTGKIYPDHDDQKSLYSLLTFCEYPSVLRVRAVHVYLDSRKNREEIYDRDQMYVMRDLWADRARKYLNALSEPDHLIPNPGFHCRYCGYRREIGGPCRF